LERLLDKLGEAGGFINANDFCSGRETPGRFLLTFDDGYDNNAGFAERLAVRGVSAIFFVVPSLIGRNAAEYLDYHRRQGVEPFMPVDALGSERGLSPVELNAIADSGHVIGAHNFAHRSLGDASDDDAVYEIDRAVDSLEQILRREVTEFAFAFGFSKDVNGAARKRLQERNLKAYTCLRGWSAVGTEAHLFHRTGIDPTQPLTSNLGFAMGRMDWATRNEREAVERLFGVGKR
jgi:peptidoglycan/xylan/chitin deacetylase (PgdA/CDA1 family)